VHLISLSASSAHKRLNHFSFAKYRRQPFNYISQTNFLHAEALSAPISFSKNHDTGWSANARIRLRFRYISLELTRSSPIPQGAHSALNYRLRIRVITVLYSGLLQLLILGLTATKFDHIFSC